MREQFKVTDAHCHVFPEKIAKRAVHGTDTFYGFEAIYQGTPQALNENGTARGVDHFIIHSVATTPKQVKSINGFIAESMHEYDNMTGLGTLHPAVERIDDDVDEIERLGLHGVKIHPDIQAFAVDDPRMMRAYALCEERGLPVLIHTGDMRYDYSNPDRVKRVLDAFPKLTVIGAHLGAWSLWRTVRQSGLIEYENFYVDSSSVYGFIEHNTTCKDSEHPDERLLLDIDRDLWVELLAAYGASRVIFGTDYPTWDITEEIDALIDGARDAGIDDAGIAMMLSGNAERVYRFT